MSTAQDPKDYFDSIHRELVFARVLGHPDHLVWWLLSVNVGLFVGAFVFGLFLFENMAPAFPGFSPLQLLFYTGMKVSTHVHEGEWWRLWSSMFVHMNFAHILFNMWGLFALGRLLEKAYGSRRLFIIYMLSGLVGAFASVYFTDAPSGGASGAIYGLAGALGVFGMKFRRELPPRVSRSLTTGMMPWIVLGIGIGFLDAIPFDNAAHIGGFLSGGVIALFMRSYLDTRHRPRKNHGVSILSGALALSLVYMLAGWSAEVTECTKDQSAFETCYPELVEKP